MGANSPIEWCHHTFNPWWGCVEVSPACGMPLPGHEGERHGTCYAKVMDARFPILGQTHWGKGAPRRFFGQKHWDEPRKWNRKSQEDGLRRRVFCGSMCDVMEDRIELSARRSKLYDLIEETPNLDWLLLTKRPQNFRRFLPQSWMERPLENVWLMTTVESPDYLWRIDSLKGCPAVVHGLSIEPLLAPMPTLGEYLAGIGWVIVGGESGPGARPMHPDSARSVRDQCVAAGVPFFFKQWGEYSSTIYLAGRRERVGKKAAGRLLDGRTWNEIPEVSL